MAYLLLLNVSFPLISSHLNAEHLCEIDLFLFYKELDSFEVLLWDSKSEGIESELLFRNFQSLNARDSLQLIVIAIGYYVSKFCILLAKERGEF